MSLYQIVKYWSTNVLNHCILGIIFNRGCCKVGSSVCPPGNTDQKVTTDTYKIHYIRCNTNNCNNGPGDDSDDTGGGGGSKGGGPVIVEGRNASVKIHMNVTCLLTLYILLCSIADVML